MPIYAYKCSSCGHAADVLQKMSADPLTECPACGKSTYSKQVTAPSFQLKGSGWYVTDFKGEKKPATVPAVADASKEGAATTDAVKTDKPTETTSTAGAESSSTTTQTAPNAAPVAASGAASSSTPSTSSPPASKAA